MLAPDIHNSTAEERREYVREAWKCMANCEICGKCSILKGRDAEEVYEDCFFSVESIHPKHSASSTTS